MSYIIECKKLRRTGLILAFFGGGLLAALIPVLNMAFRSEMYIAQNKPPLQILLDANWQMMAMLNILLIISGACALYHIEYGDNAIQKMAALPLPANRLFLGKCLVLTVLAALMLIPEILGLIFCVFYWFSGIETPGMTFFREIFAGYGCLLLLMLPLILIALLIASTFRNMWISLGINIVCVFIATMLPTNNFVLSLFPFALPFQSPAGTDERRVLDFMICAVIEILLIGIAEMIYRNIRRCFE